MSDSIPTTPEPQPEVQRADVQRADVQPTHFAFGTLEINPENAEYGIVAKVKDGQSAWPRFAIQRFDLFELPQPTNGCQYVLVINGIGYLYRNKAVARRDFDDVVAGHRPVFLRNTPI